MINKHKFVERESCRCPKCGNIFNNKTTVEFDTNERGDLIRKKTY